MLKPTMPNTLIAPMRCDALRVSIDQAGGNAARREFCRQVNGNGGLAASALPATDADNLHPFPRAIVHLCVVEVLTGFPSQLN
jgi:hypothetical protein